MTDVSPPAAARLRRGLGEGALGAALTLIAITLAHASLPDLAPASRAPPVRILPAAPPARPAAPPVLIAFREPLPDGEVGSPFGLRRLPWEDHARLHAGVDIVTPAPEPVRAAADGVVTRMGRDPGYGRFVELTHAQGLVTLYGHLARFAPGLAVGAAVRGGAPVGEIGSTGTSTGTHLHFEVHDARGRPMNPELFLGHAFARAQDLPLRAALRIPRGVRLAYVSRIPRSKQALMAARLDEGDAARPAAAATRVASGDMRIVARRSHGRVLTHLAF
ncbi:MAG: M23 family metallopeptidase [Alphaproteobacteria bacterium]|nr:M23 family metallopeptidase [Alphaproteobacteria bacterium]